MVEVASFGSPAAELETMLGNAPNDFSPVDTASDDVALLAFTSGTTGNPKITMHFHRDILAVADCFSAQILKPSPDDIFTGSPPIAFTFGLGALVIFPARIGAATALPASPAPKDLLACIKRHKATTLFTAPTAYRALLAQMKKTDISSLHSCVSAGESLPRATYDAWLSASGIELIDGIGTTEMMHIFISSPKGDIRPGATGRTVPGYQACVLGDNGRPAPVGSVGRLAVRGPTGCRYMADPRQTRYVQNGWNITGDMYCMDEDGYFYFIARTDDMIISSGYNIGGPEVENVLNDHAAVSECAVIGTPDEARGQLVTAFIVLAAGHQGDESLKQQLQAHVKATIAPYKYPRIIEFVASLPKTQTGKIQRYRLRAAQQ